MVDHTRFGPHSLAYSLCAVLLCFTFTLLPVCLTVSLMSNFFLLLVGDRQVCRIQGQLVGVGFLLLPLGSGH